MFWSYDICDKVIYEEFQNNHLQSGYHKHLANSIIRKYIITKPDGVGDTIANYLRSHYRENEKFFAIISVKFSTTSNQIRNIKRHFICHRSQQCISDAYCFLLKIKQHYSQILELRITFVSRFENIRFDHYLTKPKSMLE